MMCCSGAPKSPSAATRLSTAAAPTMLRRSLRPRSCSSWVSMFVLRIGRAWSMELSGLDARPFEPRDHFDAATNIRIELGQIFRGNPIFLVRLPAGILHLVARQEAARDLEPGHVPRAGCRHIPVARDFAGILLGQDRIEDRLLGQARRKLAKTGPLD